MMAAPTVHLTVRFPGTNTVLHYAATSDAAEAFASAAAAQRLADVQIDEFVTDELPGVWGPVTRKVALSGI